MFLLTALLSTAHAQIDGGSAGCVALDLLVRGRVVGELLVVEDGATPPRGHDTGTESWAWDIGYEWPASFDLADGGAGCVAVDTTDEAPHAAFDTAVVRLPTVTGPVYEVTDAAGAVVAWMELDTLRWWGVRPGTLGHDLHFERTTLPSGSAHPLRGQR